MEAEAPNVAAETTAIARTSDRELVVTRSFDASAHAVFQAWADPEVFPRWWVPESFGMRIVAYEADVRTGGWYRVTIQHPAAEQPMAFFGRYVEVVPDARLVWTNEEAETGPVTTVSLEERGGVTQLAVHELYPTPDALDEALASGATGGWSGQFDELERLLAG